MPEDVHRLLVVVRDGGVVARPHPLVRDAVLADAEALVSIWRDFAVHPDRPARPLTDPEVRRAVGRIDEDPDQRLVVAVVDGEPVGVAHLRRAPISPLHGENAVHVGYLHVLSRFRRRGIGKQMIETAADWADEMGSPHIVASVAATARDANRFLARLGMAPVAMVRATTVGALRMKLLSPLQPSKLPHVVKARRLRRLSAAREPVGR